MGNTQSNTPSGQCLLNAVGGNHNLVAFVGTPLYQDAYVKRWNLDIKVAPAAMTYPTTSDQVARIIKCANDANLKVQAKSGGHSYGNYGKLFVE